MKIAYLILAHNSPSHLKRLVKSLSSDSCEIYIHLDRKSNESEFSGIQGQHIHFIKERVSAFWFDFSLVEAELVLLKTAFQSPEKFDRFVLLSGSDYPIRSIARIEQFFRDNRLKEFMNIVQMPSERLGKPISRLTSYTLRPVDNKVINIFKRVLLKVRLLPRKRDYRKCFGELVPYGGSQWWALTREAVSYIQDFIQQRPEIIRYFKNTECPDETFFQTILGNSCFKKRICGNITYTDWSAGGSSPAYISETHLDRLKGLLSISIDDLYGGSDKYFARKFTDDSESLVALIDNIRAMN